MKKSILFLFLILSMFFVTVYAVEVELNSASGPGTAFDNQYIYEYDYDGASVTVVFNAVDNNFKAHISATGLKPYFTYQVKIEGPGSLAPTPEERWTNEQIGYSGRWWNGGNHDDDTWYEANKNLINIVGYLVFDWFTTDENGNWDGYVETDASYHVLFCDDDVYKSNADLYSVSEISPYNDTFTLKCDSSVAKLCPEMSVNPEIQRPAFSVLPEGEYVGVIFTLNEESFHVSCGTWTTAMTEEIEFEVDYKHNKIVDSSDVVIGEVSYDYCGDQFSGNVDTDPITTGVKNHQLKIEGKPTCVYGSEGDDWSNEQLGLEGRFWCTANCPCTINPSWGGCNIDDNSVYLAHKDDPGFCAKGYILFDCALTDDFGELHTSFVVNESYETCLNYRNSVSLPSGDYSALFLIGQDYSPWGTVGTQLVDFRIGDCDYDGIADADDNCPSIYNPGQEDADGDGIGDACDPCTDADGDTYCANIDDCDDTDASVYPGAIDIPNDGIDQDCDGVDAALGIVDFGDCSDNFGQEGWGEPAELGGAYGGLPYSEFCLVWEPDCLDDTETASVRLMFTGMVDELITIRHLDGMSTYDSFNVYVDDVLVGTYTDSLFIIEDWIVTSFPVTVDPGVHIVRLEITDPAWSSCDLWGQLAIDYIELEEPCTLITSYRDYDGDGYGNPAVFSYSCIIPDGYVLDNTDCDDTDASIYPGAIDIPNDGIDQDCDGVDAAPGAVDFGDCSDDFGQEGWGEAVNDGTYGGLDESEFCLVWELTCVDDTEMASVDLTFSGTSGELITIRHLDGMSTYDSFNVYVDDVLIGHYADTLVIIEDWVTTSFPVDVDPGIHTVKLVVTDPAWSSCDLWGQLAIDYIKVEEPCTLITSYRDYDGDGYGNPAVFSYSCIIPDGYVLDNTDCDDTDAGVNPSATEICDGIDNNCNGIIDEGCGTVFGPGAGTGIGIMVEPEEFKPRIWMDPNTRVVLDDYNMPGVISGGGENLTERVENYAFTGEQIYWQVVVWDKNGIEKINDVYVRLSETINSPDYIEANCRESDRTELPFDVWEGEENVTWNPTTMRWYSCLLTVEPQWHGEYYVAAVVTDLNNQSDEFSENEFWFFNPVIALGLTGTLNFGTVRPGSTVLSDTILLRNNAEPGSGVLLDMFIAGTDFYDPSQSGAACPDSNVLRLNNFRYRAVSGAYQTCDHDSDVTAAIGGGNFLQGVDSQCYVGIPYYMNGAGSPGNNNYQRIISGTPTAFGWYSAGNVLSPGADISLNFKLSLPEPCIGGPFTSGEIKFYGQAI